MPEFVYYLVGLAAIIVLLAIGTWVIENAQVEKDDSQTTYSQSYWMGVASDKSDDFDFGDD